MSEIGSLSLARVQCPLDTTELGVGENAAVDVVEKDPTRPRLDLDVAANVSQAHAAVDENTNVGLHSHHLDAVSELPVHDDVRVARRFDEDVDLSRELRGCNCDEVVVAPHLETGIRVGHPPQAPCARIVFFFDFLGLLAVLVDTFGPHADLIAIDTLDEHTASGHTHFDFPIVLRLKRGLNRIHRTRSRRRQRQKDDRQYQYPGNLLHSIYPSLGPRPRSP